MITITFETLPEMTCVRLSGELDIVATTNQVDIFFFFFVFFLHISFFFRTFAAFLDDPLNRPFFRYHGNGTDNSGWNSRLVCRIVLIRLFNGDTI